jgi:Carboxypeptidase regulatory-like domain/TonB dependent receptor
MSNRVRTLLGLSVRFFISMIFVSHAFAQSTFGTFVGTVKDPSGRVVLRCIVTITNNGTSAKRSTYTDKEGDYVVVNLEPGTYQILMQAPGFQPTTFPSIDLLSRQTIRTDGTLALAGQSASVTVNAEVESVITTEVSNIAETKLGRELNDLPVAIASRGLGSTSAITTLTTQAGVQTDNSGNLSVAGSKPSMLSVSIDGISTMSPRSSAPIAELFPSFGGIAEIRVSEVNNAAEYGGVSDITTVSKSGSNVMQGGFFENLQNTALDARNPFSARVTQVNMNDFGGYLGGPALIPHVYNGKNKTFFFFDYEGLKLPRQQFVDESVPSLALRNGDLSVYPGLIKDLSGSPLPGNQVPQSEISPVAKAVLQYLFPLPNLGVPNAIINNFAVNFPTPISSNQEDLRFDQNISSRQTMFFRATYKTRDITNAPLSTGTILAGGLHQPETDYAFTLAHNFIITPNLVNELRLGVSATTVNTSDSANAPLLTREIGIALPQPPIGNITPTFSVNGFQGTGSTRSGINVGKTQQLIDNMTWTRGSHTLKFGGDIRKLGSYLSNGMDAQRAGEYTFNGSVTNSIIGNPYAAFLLGVPDETQVSVTDLGLASSDVNSYATHYAAFAQDDWKVSPRLTLNYGVRWEYHPAFKDHLYNIGIFIPDVYSVIDGVSVHGEVAMPDQGYYLKSSLFQESIAPTPVITTSQAGLPTNLHYADKREFAPRGGFVYRATADGKAVIRGGVGKFIEPEMATLVDSAGAVPESYVGNFTNTLVNGKPTLTLASPFPANLVQPGSQIFSTNTAIHYSDPYVLQWNFTIERDLGFNTGLRLSYDGSHGYNLGYEANIAQIPANKVGYATAKAVGASPYPLWDSLNTYLQGARSNYDAVTIEGTKRLSNGLQFSGSYTYAKSLSNGQGYDPTAFASEGGGQVTDAYNINLDYGNVSFTHRDRLLATALYELPFGAKRMFLGSANKFLDVVVGGWELAGYFLAQTGPFLTVVVAGADPEGDGFPTVAGNGRADIVSGVNVVPANQSINNWINTVAFATPPNNIGRGPTSPVGSVAGPGTQSLSLSLFKAFLVHEGVRFQIGAAAANALNHPNYTTPNLTYGTAAFGTITNVQTQENGGPRSLQVTARVTF